MAFGISGGGGLNTQPPLSVRHWSYTSHCLAPCSGFTAVTDSLNISLTSCSSVPIVKLILLQPAYKPLAFYGTPNLRFRIHNSHRPVLILSQISPVYALSSHFSKVYFNIIPPSAPISPKWSLSLRFPHHNSVCVCLLHHSCYIPPTHFIPLDF